MALVETLNSYLSSFLNWFGGLPLEGQILYGVLIIFLSIAIVKAAYYFIYGVAWLVGHAVYGVFWLTAEILKATFMGLIIMHYALFKVFVMLPLVAIFDKHFELGAYFEEFGHNVEDFVERVYPPAKNEKENTPVPAPAPSIQVIVQTAPAAAQPTPVQPATPAFHCSNCGDAFTPRMALLLKEKKVCFCEHCGQRFVEENNLPLPVVA
jgi:DNA-directed RNA polymerase subunit RPC12/RpoP